MNSKIELTKRPYGFGIFRVSDYIPGKLLIDFPIEDSRSVTLKYKDKYIIVENIKKNDDGTFNGFIVGFEPGYFEEFEGLKVNDSMMFNEEEVFTAGK